MRTENKSEISGVNWVFKIEIKVPNLTGNLYFKFLEADPPIIGHLVPIRTTVDVGRILVYYGSNQKDVTQLQTHLTLWLAQLFPDQDFQMIPSEMKSSVYCLYLFYLFLC